MHFIGTFIILIVVSLSSTANATNSMSNKKAHLICENIVNKINTGKMSENLIRFSNLEEVDRKIFSEIKSTPNQINGIYRVSIQGKNRVFAKTSDLGSCGECSIIDTQSTQTELYPPDDQEHFRWAHWGNCDHLLLIHGEPIVVSGRFMVGESVAGLISWIAPDGAKRALCHLTRKNHFSYVQRVNLNKGLCTAAIQSNLEYLPWSAKVSTEKLKKRNQKLAVPFDHTVDLLVDLDMDKKIDHIVRLNHSNSAGCGSSEQWLASISPNGSIETNSPLNAALLAAQRGPIQPTTTRSDIQIFKYQENPYVVMSSRSTFVKDINMSVTSFWQGIEQEWCSYTILPKHAVLKYYPVETWPAR
ncbi:hypothetical protein [Undibacterium flavidum]|uniref:Uncharacterized protein n=1 Tax=Undibacterium flavidum TaxID=2762297 RepID=A0ABR6Y7L2_9BURK|nr:hypothetical protein [Undibacterium flavidum]MBC3872580.1 hypothetical protein [Undibacterium flavidum]